MNKRAPMHQFIESLEVVGRGGGGGWPDEAGLVQFSTPKCCPMGWGHT